MLTRLGIMIIMLLPLCSFAGNHHSQSTRELGDIGRFAIPAASALVPLYYKDNTGLKQFALTLGGTLLLTQGLKSVVNEERPCNHSKQSFPSGHTAWAFSGATFLHRRYGFKTAIPAYIAATAVAYSRVRARRHHVHDVIAGAGVAAFNAVIFTRPLTKNITLSAETTADHGMQVTAKITLNKKVG